MTPDLPIPPPMYARTVLDLSAEVERADAAIKAEILRAARAGDSQRVAQVVERWLSLPVAEVLAPSSPKPACTMRAP